MYRYYLDNILVDEPTGFDDFITNIKRDESLKGIFISKDISLTFRGSGYTYLKTNFDALGHCVEVQVRIEKLENANWIYFYEGVIFLTDVQWQDFNKQASVKVTERSYSARIFNNKSIGVIPTSTVSKNLFTTITDAPVYQMGLFDPSVGTKIGTYCRVLRVDEVLNNMVQWMSDGEMDLLSDYFTDTAYANFNIGSYTKGVLLLTTGYAIRRAGNSTGISAAEFSQNMKTLSFNSLFSSLDKQFKIRLSVVQNTSPRQLQIEQEPYFRTGTNIIKLTDVEEVKTKTAVERLYNRVKFGSNEVLNVASVDFPESIRFVGFNQEEYYVLGQCNIDNTLDLETEIVTSSNVIQYVIDNPSDTQYDEKWFLIHATETPYLTSGFQFDAISTNWLGAASPYYYYNEILTNAYVANRYLGGVPNSIATSLVAQDNSFDSRSGQYQGSPVVGTATFEPYVFDIEVSDPNGNYNNATYEYTAPVSGQYSFSVSLPLIFDNQYPANGVPNSSNQVDIYLVVYDSGGFAGGTIIQTRTIFSQVVVAPHNTQYDVSVSGSVSLTGGEKVVVRVDLENWKATALGIGTFVRVKGLAVFACTATADGGGIYNQYDPSLYPVLTHEMEYLLTDRQIRFIEAGVTGQISFAVNGEVVKSGWIETIKHNHKTGKSSIKLMSNKILNG